MKNNTHITSISDVDNIILNMDKPHNTNFHSWIRNQNNISFICIYKKHIFLSYIDSNINISHGLNWMMTFWTPIHISTFISYVFHKYINDIPKYTSLIYDITHHLDINIILDILLIILHQSNTQYISTFLDHFQLLHQNSHHNLKNEFFTKI